MIKINIRVIWLKNSGRLTSPSLEKKIILKVEFSHGRIFSPVVGELVSDLLVEATFVINELHSTSS